LVFELKGRVIFFATGNINKFNEARHILREFNIVVGMLRVKAVEIQNDSLEEIAKISVLEAFKKTKLPTIVEDAGLFIETLNGFPGPYAAYVYKTIGNTGVLRLMENLENRKARFQSSVAYLASDLEIPICFEGHADGEITNGNQKNEGLSGFGFDPIFKPFGSSKTFAEMSIADKNIFSHRANALRKFGEWYRKLESKKNPG
jgi:XTP/dITP diphosphohydrolase